MALLEWILVDKCVSIVCFMAGIKDRFYYIITHTYMGELYHTEVSFNLIPDLMRGTLLGGMLIL